MSASTSPAIRLTAYSHGAGCGCKIAPAVLDSILAGQRAGSENARLLVGNSGRDDAAVYDLGHGQALISTTDFFMPIVDDPFDFGRIAAANAISDVYAMGGRPTLALAILGWPIDKLPPQIAGEVLRGARAVCDSAGAVLAGGHSIDSPEPIFGLAVNGLAPLSHIKGNDGAKAGDLLFLTKPLGIGILTTAEKKGLLRPEHQHTARDVMLQLNSFGERLGALPWVHAMTDVTGFGLFGHLCQLCEASGVSAAIFSGLPRTLPGALEYLAAGAIPGGCKRNQQSFAERVAPLESPNLELYFDPQTSGGLLIAIEPSASESMQALLREQGLDAHCEPVGRIEAYQNGQPRVQMDPP
ncbi:MAG: selenide, water dikinase SelD [Leptospirales bacterium]|nr:selenide, water dikinase SelD [Leptospirales bacterium]